MGSHICKRERCQVPPSPHLISQLYARYLELQAEGRLPDTLTFDEFYKVWRSRRRGDNEFGLDDGAVEQANADAPQLIQRPQKKLRGIVRTLVLLADFDDRPNTGHRGPGFFNQMLFDADNAFPSGSMREYYRAISAYDASAGTGIDVQGEVRGWYRLPHPSSYYTDGASGMGSFPRNAQGMARDAVRAALAEGVDFTSFDSLGEKQVTALFIVHAGSGAEQSGNDDDIWSLKWVVPGSVDVGNGVRVSTFLTVPENCDMGVCAHEWGHLAARWADYYDTGRKKNWKSNGLGNYCLMASGSWGNGGLTPTFPNGMLRVFHEWIEPNVVTESVAGIVLAPAAECGSVAIIHNPARMAEGQYIFAEYRRRRHQDAYLPDEGVAIYVVDENIDN